MSPENDATRSFIDHWSKAETSEMANSQSFIKDLTDKGTAKTKIAKGTTKKAKKKVASKAKQVWPKPPAERIRATEQALHAAAGAISPAEPAKPFARAQPAAVQEILESLVTLGRAQQQGETFNPLMTLMIGHVNLGT